MPRIHVTEYDVAAGKLMQDRKLIQLKSYETFIHRVDLGIPGQSRPLVIELQYNGSAEAVSRVPIISEHLMLGDKAMFQAPLITPEVHIILLHWLNATFVIASTGHTDPADLAKRFEKKRSDQAAALPAYVFVGNHNKSLRTQPVSTSTKVAEAA